MNSVEDDGRGYPDDITDPAVRAVIDAHPCGECQVCCTVAEVVEGDVNTPAGTRCAHQCASGCAIYKKRPRQCSGFLCWWKIGCTRSDRPDRSGVMWWAAGDSNDPGEPTTVRCDIDLSVASDEQIALAFEQSGRALRNGYSVWIRCAGDGFSLIRVPNEGGKQALVAMSATRLPGESDASKMARTELMAPTMRARWADLVARAQRARSHS